MMITLYGREKNLMDIGSTWFKNNDKWSTSLKIHPKGGGGL